MIQNPPMCSLASLNGPSVTMASPSVTLTTVAVSAGWSPPAKTQIPASRTLALKVSTAA